jgi:hypothetical protein
MPRPRELPVFFIDHCLGTEKVAQRLRAAGVDARVLVEEAFSEDAEDVDWLPVVADKGWAILTKDKRIRHRALEREAIRQSGGGAFILTASGLAGDAIGEAFVRALPQMIRIWNTRATVHCDRQRSRLRHSRRRWRAHRCDKAQLTRDRAYARSSRSSRRSRRNANPRFEVVWAWFIAAKRCVCSRSSRSGWRSSRPT